jgi:UDP-glucose 4-epimerase
LRVLVTGGAGFIGSNLCRVLRADGAAVVALDNLSTGYRANLERLSGVELVERDIREPAAVDEAVRGCEIVFHLAASVGNRRSIEDPVADSETNVLGTLRVLEAARNAGVRKVVYSSSAAIFGELKHLPIREDHPVEPDSPYGASKLAAEKQSLAFGRLFDLEVVCLRYFNVYGVNQRYDAYGNVIPIFANRLLRGQPLIIYGDGEQTRDFVHVDDVVRANIAAALAPGVTGAFNIGSAMAVTINRLAELMRTLGGSPVAIEHAPARPGDVRHSRADITAARDALGFRPGRQLEDGLREYQNWVRTQLVAA